MQTRQIQQHSELLKSIKSIEEGLENFYRMTQQNLQASEHSKELLREFKDKQLQLGIAYYFLEESFTKKNNWTALIQIREKSLRSWQKYLDGLKTFEKIHPTEFIEDMKSGKMKLSEQYEHLGSYYYELGDEYVNEKQYVVAIFCYEKVIEICELLNKDLTENPNHYDSEKVSIALSNLSMYKEKCRNEIEHATYNLHHADNDNHTVSAVTPASFHNGISPDTYIKVIETIEKKPHDERNPEEQKDLLKAYLDLASHYNSSAETLYRKGRDYARTNLFESANKVYANSLTEYEKAINTLDRIPLQDRTDEVVQAINIYRVGLSSNYNSLGCSHQKLGANVIEREMNFECALKCFEESIAYHEKAFATLNSIPVGQRNAAFIDRQEGKEDIAKIFEMFRNNLNKSVESYHFTQEALGHAVNNKSHAAFGPSSLPAASSSYQTANDSQAMQIDEPDEEKTMTQAVSLSLHSAAASSGHSFFAAHRSPTLGSSPKESFYMDKPPSPKM